MNLNTMKHLYYLNWVHAFSCQHLWQARINSIVFIISDVFFFIACEVPLHDLSINGARTLQQNFIFTAYLFVPPIEQDSVKV